RGKKGAIIAVVARTLAAGGSVWFADETTLREFPPLRAAWARRGEQAVVTISGRNARRVLHGAVNVATGEVVRVVRERNRGADSAALVAALATRTPAGRSLLVWDNAPAHHTRVPRETAAAVGITILPLPFRAPELMPCEDVWRELKRVVAANRAYADVDELVARAVAWLDDRTPEQILHLSGVTSSKFDWLPT
ncbi:MAG TPA: IS630 family transposase, partial [Thermomicrobiales bacterium]